MKTKIILIILTFILSQNINQNLFAQGLEIFDIDTTNYPTIKAKFYAYDKDGKIQRPTKDQLKIFENGTERQILEVSCPQEEPKSLSLGLMVDFNSKLNVLDQNFSIIQNSLNLPFQDELGIIYMDKYPFIHLDFSNNFEKIKNSLSNLPLSSGAILNNMFLFPQTGGIDFIKKRYKQKKSLILISDLHCPILTLDTTLLFNLLIKEEIKVNVILLNSIDYTGIFRNITNKTNGLLVENSNIGQDFNIILKKIIHREQEEYCYISWESGKLCYSNELKLDLKYNNTQTSKNFVNSKKSLNNINIFPNVINFGRIKINQFKDTTISLKSLYSDLIIEKIENNNDLVSIEIENLTLPFHLKKDLEYNFKLKYKTLDSNIIFSNLTLKINNCDNLISLKSGSTHFKYDNLKVVSPNGFEKFIAGFDTLIKWDGVTYLENVSIEFTSNNGISWNFLDFKDNGLNYKWNNIPNISSDSCLIKISHLDYYDNYYNLENLFLKSHTNHINFIDWSPDSKYLLTASFDSTSKIWDTFNGKLLNTLNGHWSYVSQAVWSPDGTKIATGGFDHYLIIWDFKQMKMLHKLKGHSQSIYNVVWSPDGTKIATGGLNLETLIWDVASGALLFTLEPHARHNFHIAWSPDGTKIATGHDDYQLTIWESSNGKLYQYRNIHKDGIKYISWNPEGNKLVTASKDKTAKIWDLNKGDVQYTFEHSNTINKSKWSPDGKYIATCGKDKILNIWDAISGQLLSKLYSHVGEVFDIDWDPSSRYLASVGEDKYLKVWEISADYKLVKNEILHKDKIYNVKWSPNGKYIATGSSDHSAIIWELFPTPLQTDISDNVFSIIVPEPVFEKLDIDMGEEIIGFGKDTMVTCVLSNKGEAPLHVLGVDVTSGDVDDFMVPRGAGDFILEPNECRDMMFAFEPTKVGLREAKITVRTTIGDFKDTITIKGTGVKPEVIVINDLINLGKSKINKEKDSVQIAVIKNVSKSPIKITNIYQKGPNYVDFVNINEVKNATVLPNEDLKLDLRFKPTEKGRTSGTLFLEYDGLGSPLVVQLFGEGWEKTIAKMNIRTINIEEYQDAIVDFPIKITNLSDFEYSEIESIDLDLTFDHNLLEPFDYPAQKINDKLSKITLENLKFENITSPLSIVKFKVLEGGEAKSDIILNINKVNGGNAEISFVNGSFTRLDICNQTENLTKLERCQKIIRGVNPNPSDYSFEIELMPKELGNSKLEIYDISGRKVMTIFERNIIKIEQIRLTHLVGSLSHGNYRLVFTSPNNTENISIVISK